jgi:hypothetical protein
MTADAGDLRDYYEASEEVKEWLDAEDGVMDHPVSESLTPATLQEELDARASAPEREVTPHEVLAQNGR